MAPFARRRATLLTLALLLSSTARARAQPRGDPCTVARLVGLVDLCAPRDTADASAPSPGDDACCAELRALNDARCFCREPFLTLPQPQQSALVPALANGPRRCGVNTRVGDRCLSVVRPEPRPPPAPLSPTQPRPQPVPVPVLVPPPPGEMLSPSPSPGATTSPSPSPSPSPAPAPAPPRNSCAASELVRFVQDGCAATLAAASEDDALASCCDRLRAFNDAACFCLDETAPTLRAFPANFRRAFGAAPARCGVVVRGGWQCAPFPAEAAWTRGEGTTPGTTLGRPFPPAPPYPPYPPFPSPPLYPPFPSPPPSPPFPSPRVPPANEPAPFSDFDAFNALVCRPEALVSLAEQRCDRIAFATFAASAAGDACCERVGLLNAVLCFCDSKLASLVGQRRERLARTFVAAPMACGIAVYARIDDDWVRGDASGDETAGDETAGDETACRAVRSLESPPSPPSPPFPPRPPRPSRPRAPTSPTSPPPKAPEAPSGPRGPPGPPGRDAAGSRALGWFVSRASCPPWVRACRGDERGWEYLGRRWKGEDDVFSWKPRAPPGLESVGR